MSYWKRNLPLVKNGMAYKTLSTRKECREWVKLNDLWNIAAEHSDLARKLDAQEMTFKEAQKIFHERLEASRQRREEDFLRAIRKQGFNSRAEWKEHCEQRREDEKAEKKKQKALNTTVDTAVFHAVRLMPAHPSLSELVKISPYFSHMENKRYITSLKRHVKHRLEQYQLLQEAIDHMDDPKDIEWDEPKQLEVVK